MKLFSDIKPILKGVYEKGFFHLFSSNILIQIFSFASQLFVTGILSPDDLGRIKIIQTYLSIFMVIGSLGFSSSVLKYCSSNTISPNDRFKLFYHSLLFSLISSSLLYIIILTANSLGLLSNDSGISILIPIGTFPVITNILFWVFTSYSQALKQIKLFSMLTISNKLISILGIILLTYLFGIKGYFVAYNLSFILMLILCFSLVFSKYKISKIEFTKESIRSNFKKLWRFGSTSMLTNLVNTCMMYMDVLLISYLINDAHGIGYYGFALTLTILFGIFPSTVQQISIPYFSTNFNNVTEFKKVFKKYNKLLYIVVIVSFIVAIVFVPPFVSWIFRGKYDESIQYFIPLAIGWSITQLKQLQVGAIFGLGKVQFNLYGNLIMLGINIIFFSFSLHYFGLIGAAYTTIITNTIAVTISRIFLRKAYNQVFNENKADIRTVDQ